MYISSITVDDDVDLYFVGDIHGQYKEFMSVFKEASLNPKRDVVVSVGDLVDRGKQNFRCLAEFLHHPNRYMVLGNHEDLMVNGLVSREHYHCWVQNGGDVTLEEFGDSGWELMSKFIKDAKVPLVLEVHHRGKTFVVAHGGIHENVKSLTELHNRIDSEPMLRENLVWNREQITRIERFGEVYPNFEGADFTIHGHTGTTKPVLNGNRMWIDTKFVGGSITLAQYTGNGPLGGWVFYTEPR